MTAPDRFDLAIIAELQRNARITITELASRVGLSKTPSQVRMRRPSCRSLLLPPGSDSDWRTPLPPQGHRNFL